MGYQQINLFSESIPLFKIGKKPIRLIEAFAGIGSQSKALDILGLPYEHHKIVEWAYNSFVMYNMIHQKDGGTRSGLLWEIERILDELKSMSERERERISCHKC